MSVRPSVALIGLACALILAACSAQRQAQSTDVLRAILARPRETATVASTRTTRVPSPTGTTVSIPTPAPTPSPWPEVRLSVPEYLQRIVKAAIQEIESAEPAWRWNCCDTDEPGDIRLVPGEGAVPAGNRAVALTVPFATEWEGLSATEANDIIAGGHELVSIVDWAEMPSWRKALRVDGLLPADPGYPLNQAWSLAAAPGFEEAARQLAPALRNSINRDPVLHLVAVGDLMLARALGYAIQSGDLSYPFDSVTSELEIADVTVGNLESALGDLGQPAAKSYTFRAPPAAADSLAGAGFDLLTLANNHALDYGPEALLQAIQLLDERGIAVVGAGTDASSAREPAIVEHEGLKLAFLGYVDVPVEVSGFDTRSWSATGLSPGLAWAELDQITKDVAAANEKSDVVIVLLHSGYEYVEPPSPAQMLAAQAAVDAGADLVIGHHAHVLQGVEFRGNSVIAYGLGNFAFEIDGDPTTTILNVWLDEQGVRQIEYVPAIIEAGGRPRIAAPWEASKIRRKVYYLTNLLNETP